jgi:hypothetical protein
MKIAKRYISFKIAVTLGELDINQHMYIYSKWEFKNLQLLSYSDFSFMNRFRQYDAMFMNILT